ncbi:MAG: adenylosuccinate synthase [Bdellovibrionaceae bacterium]|nr:adenylosuccinate synthase [Pseudobdellovibrionaceae bacterium]MDW8191238.1 adenylosuccinate synthase [Pseudobdellovibrionaceae bacterium]
MSGVVVVGAQWGDEGKGKIVDILSEHADIVVRFQGGPNAGHTLVIGGKKTVLHLIPSGIFHPDTTCMIASGTVIDLEGLVSEIDFLKSQGFLSNHRQLLISDQATVIFPFHKLLDQARESSLSENKIGTTGRGIGPAYEDRASRRAILFRDLFEPDRLKEVLELNLAEKNALFKFYKQKAVTTKSMLEWAAQYAEKLLPHKQSDMGSLIYRALKTGKRVIFEGAQGTMLDVFHGTYPFVTSSSTVAASACIGTGIPPQSISSVIGVIKAYTTRVGQGPFPSELLDEVGQQIQKVGNEFGSTTGRPRRCGWLDLVSLKYAIRINGITNLALMKLDVLSGLDKIGVCTAYDIGGTVTQEIPSTLNDWHQAKPVIEFLPGWKEDLTKVMTLKDLPRNATVFIDFISKQLATPVDAISVGPGREQTLWVKPLFAN